MNRHPLILSGNLLLTLLILQQGSYAQDPTTDPLPQQATPRLHLEIDEYQDSKLEFEGRVTVQNKYSIVVTTDEQVYPVEVLRDTRITLRLETPHFDFDKGTVAIGIEGLEKKYKAYKFREPMFIRADFAHRRQFDRIMGNDVKRLSNFIIQQTRPTDPQGERIYCLIGDLRAGSQGRQLKLTDGDNSHDVFLASGTLTGFSVLDLDAKTTQVRVRGVLRGEKVLASEILFWPKSRTNAATKSDN